MAGDLKIVNKPEAMTLKRSFILGICVMLAWLLCASGVSAQQTGILEGRLVNGTDPAIVPGHVSLEVVSLSGGMDIIRTTETDPGGAFRIEGLPIRSMLMLRAIYQEATYNKQFRFDDSGKARVELEVFEATTSMAGIRVEETQMVFQAIDDHLQMLETLVLSNETDPPRTFMSPEGNFRFSKAPGIESLPQIRITAPGSSMPVVQSALESPDGESYYSLYPLRPGKTTIDVFQVVPYESLKYVLKKKFYYRVPSIEIGVIPMDMELEGAGLTRVRTEAQRNIAVYRSGAVEAGKEIEWILSGGTPVSEPEAPAGEAESKIRAVPTVIGGKNARIIGPLILLLFILVLWYAFHRPGKEHLKTAGARRRQLKARREAVIKQIVDLDRRYEAHATDRRHYQKERAEGMRMLRRITTLLQKD